MLLKEIIHSSKGGRIIGQENNLKHLWRELDVVCAYEFMMLIYYSWC